MAKARRYFRWQSRLIAPHLGQRVVEVGCGTGNFTRFLLDRPAVLAVDVERACIERLLVRYPNQDNLQVHVLEPVAGALGALRVFQPDSCVCLNVLEHIEDDLQAVRDMAAILPPGGTIVLLVPAFPALSGPIDRQLGHFRRYRARDVRSLASRARLQLRTLRFVNSVGFFGWWANSHLFRFDAPPEWQIALFDRCVVPVLSRLEAIVPPPFGQSLFAVLGNPERAVR